MPAIPATTITIIVGFLAAWLFNVSTIIVIVVAGIAGIAYKIISEKSDKGGAE